MIAEKKKRKSKSRLTQSSNRTIMEKRNSNPGALQTMKSCRTMKSKRTISDSESQASQIDSFFSPLHPDDPSRSPDPNGKAIVPSENFYSATSTPTYQHPPPPPPPPPPGDYLKFQSRLTSHREREKRRRNERDRSSSMVLVNGSVKEDVPSTVAKVGPFGGGGGGGDGGETGRKITDEAVASVFRRSLRTKLGFRICEMILCLISFSVMAADRTQGWSGDSFDRYKEYRYVVAVTVIGFVYSGFQAYHLTYHLVTKKQVPSQLFHCFEFFMDQILAYLLMSASSSAATRINDWTANWGSDDFTEMASASVGMSFLAFAAFAMSSLISGYTLCNHNYA